MQSVELEICGMTCGHCVSSVTRALLGVDGVVHADVSYSRKHAHVEHDGTCSPQSLIAAVEEEGYLACISRAESRV
jgi:copper chaperone CopZ